MKSSIIYKNKLIYSFILVIIAIFIVATTIYGWFTINDNVNTGGFLIYVRGNISAHLYVDGVNYVGNYLSLGHTLPGDEYLFQLFISVSENSTDSFIRISIVNPMGEFFSEEFNKYGDMSDVMAIKYPYDSETYTRINDLDNYIISQDIPILEGEPTEVKFLLMFTYEPPEGEDINLYQGKSFTIDKIKIETY